MPTIRFTDDQVDLAVEPGTRLLEVCDSEPRVSLLFGCREANCGTCLIEVLEGMTNLSPVQTNELELLEVLAADNPRARLGCQCVVHGDVQVRTLDH